MEEDYTATSKVKEEREAAEMEATLQEREARADSKHDWISDPLETYGDYLYVLGIQPKTGSRWRDGQYFPRGLRGVSDWRLKICAANA
jgi:hypothetical protein